MFVLVGQRLFFDCCYDKIVGIGLVCYKIMFCCKLGIGSGFGNVDMFEYIVDVGIWGQCVEYYGVVVGGYVIFKEWIVWNCIDVVWWWW